MAYHVFNIGLPATSAWWQQNLERGVITAGFDAQAGDRGDVILRDMDEGDWILAYCKGHGFVGAGMVGPLESYRLHADVPIGSLSDHQHERSVDWRHAVNDVEDAVATAESRRHAPRQTKERERDEAAAERIISRLAARNVARKPAPAVLATAPKYWHVLEAVRAIGRPCTVKEIQEWLKAHYRQEDTSDVRDNACLFTVNDANRRHHDKPRKDFRSDSGNPKDALYREGRFSNVTYESYRPAVHGVWDIRQSTPGAFEAVRIAANSMRVALAEAQQLVAAEQADPITSDHDSRVREMRAVVLREGQGEFRAGLLTAYGNRCAMTGCGVIEILEAAHIRPYRGAETNRTDNGLLLRADIHTLFDKGLLWLEDDFAIGVAERLRGSEYEALAGTKLRVPSDPIHRPHVTHVSHHRLAAVGEQD